MDDISSERLQALGLSPSEARAYLALLRAGAVGASTVSEIGQMTRSSAYAALRTLADLGLVEAGAGYGSRFRAVPPEEALPALIDRQREAMTVELERREGLAKELAVELGRVAEEPAPQLGEVVEVIRDRRAVAERYDRIQLEAREQIASIVKAPILTGGDENPAQDVMLERGVRVRGLYEREVLEHPEIKPYLRHWIDSGEEARIYPGTLPLKYEVIDGLICMLPLETPADRSPVTTLIIRHESLGAALQLLYEFLWERSEPIE